MPITRTHDWATLIAGNGGGPHHVYTWDQTMNGSRQLTCVGYKHLGIAIWSFLEAVKASRTTRSSVSDELEEAVQRWQRPTLMKMIRRYDLQEGVRLTNPGHPYGVHHADIGMLSPAQWTVTISSATCSTQKVLSVEENECVIGCGDWVVGVYLED